MSINANNSSGSNANTGGPGNTAVAQLAEQRIPNPQVAGSIPSRRVSDGGNNNRPGEVAEGGGWGIYKFGQGYWVRVLTAIFAGTLILAGGVWSWSRTAIVSVPITGYALSVTQVTGAVSGGATVDLFKGQEKVGTGTVDSFSLFDDKKSGLSRISAVSFEKGKVVADVDRVRVGEASAPTFAAAVAAREPKYLFPRIYLQGAVSGLIVLIGCFFLYRLVGYSPPSVDFLVATDSEMKKVNWSTRQVIQDSTMVVIGATFLIAAYIFISDFGLSKVMEVIGVLQR